MINRIREFFKNWRAYRMVYRFRKNDQTARWAQSMNAHYDEVEIQGRVYHQIYYVNRNSLFPYGDLLIDDAKVTTTAWYNPFPSLSEADIIPNFNDIRGYLYDHKMIASLKDMKVKNGLIEVTTKEIKIDNVIKVNRVEARVNDLLSHVAVRLNQKPGPG